MYLETLKLISTADSRRPSPLLPSRLDELFQRLANCADPLEATRTEDLIWGAWMYHPHRAVAQALDRSASDIAAQRYDIAETRLARLLNNRPDVAEGWNKRATLYYIQSRDDESVCAINRTLELEPRHFGAICGFGEICLTRGDREAAACAFVVALRIHPHLTGVRDTLRELIGADLPPH